MKNLVSAGKFPALVLMLYFQSLVANSAPPPVSDTSSTDFNIRDESFLLPQVLPSGKYSSALYLLNVFVPKDWTLDMIKAPMFCYAGKYTLRGGFNLQASLATLFVSTRINAGPFWNRTYDRFHLGLGYQVGNSSLH